MGAYFNVVGNWEFFNIEFSILNSKYFDGEINLLNEIFEIANDIFVNADLTKEKFEKRKNLKKQQICGNISKRSYAYKQFRRYMYDNVLEDPYQNKEQAINDLKYEDVLEVYNELSSRGCKLLIVGDVTEEEITSAYGNHIFNRGNKIPNFVRTLKYVDVEEPKIIEEAANSRQSHLYMGYRTNILWNAKDTYTLAILNYMLAGDSFSTLFKEIREKRSLAYNVSINKSSNNTIVIYTGINAEDYEETVSVINEVLNDYAEGRIDPNVLEMSKLALSDGTITEYDRIGYYCDYVYNCAWGFQTIKLEDRIKIADSITIEDIMKLSKRLQLDTSFFLRGEL